MYRFLFLRFFLPLNAKVFVGNVEVHRTRVIPMTLCLVWAETFIVSPPPPPPDGGASGEGVEGGEGRGGLPIPWGLRLEVWDHDIHGTGDFLGELVTNAADSGEQL